MEAKDMLAAIDEAIFDLVSSGKSEVTVGNKTFKRVDLQALESLRSYYATQCSVKNLGSGFKKTVLISDPPN